MMDEAKLAWADLVQAYPGGKVMFVSTPELGEDHCWEGVRNGVYCIWREEDEERWEIYQRQHLMVLMRPKVTDPNDPAQIYEATIQEVIKRLRQLTFGSFDAPTDVQRQRYTLAVEVFEDWLSKLGDMAAIFDREYLEMIIDQNPIAHKL
jgi:hypothetical protein